MLFKKKHYQLKHCHKSTINTDLYVALEGLIIDALVLRLDAAEVDLGAAGDDADERLILRPGALHGPAQALREPRRGVLHTLNCK